MHCPKGHVGCPERSVMLVRGRGYPAVGKQSMNEREHGRTAAGDPIRVVLISPVRIYLQGLAHLLRAEAGFEVVATAVGVDAGARLVSGGGADVVLLDLTVDLGGQRGLDALHRLA